MNDAPLVYLVTLDWSRPGDTIACLEAAASQTYARLRLLVVDNGSADDSVPQIRNRFPDVEVLGQRENLGFARGANLGLKRALAAGADHVFLVNNDTLLDPGAVAQLVGQARPEHGILAPIIYMAEDRKRIWSAGGRLRPWVLDKSGDGRGKIDTGRWAGPEEQDFVTGCGMMLSRRLLETVGLFDERFFMYYEDFDLCLRARQRGFQIVLVPAARMWHRVAQSSGGSNSANERYWMARSSVLFFLKHVRGAQWLAVVPWRMASAVRTTLRLAGSGRWDACAAYWRGLWDGLRGG